MPQDPLEMRKDIYFCSGCNQYLPSTEFQLATNSRSVGRCRKCTKTDNDARVRQDYSHYRYMLKSLRRQEEAYGDGSKIAFLLQVSFHILSNLSITGLCLSCLCSHCYLPGTWRSADDIPKVLCKTVVSPLKMYRRYHSFARQLIFRHLIT